MSDDSGGDTRTAAVLGGIGRGHWPAIFLLGLGLLAGLVLVRDFGMSTDEYDNATVGRLALNAYGGSRDYFGLGSLKDHGPVYFMLFSATSEAINRVLPGWLLPDGRHLTNYLTFLAGLIGFYIICLRLMRRTSALMATALLASQPVIFGSAFINQKDIPFMSLFLAVIALGLLAGGRHAVPASRGSTGMMGGLKFGLKTHANRIKSDWLVLDQGRRRLLLLGVAIGLLIMLDLFFVGLVNRLGRSLVAAAYNGHAPMPVQWLYSRLATDAYKTSLEQYLARYGSLFSKMRLGLLILFALGGCTAFVRALPVLDEILRGPSWKVRYPALVGGAVMLGCAISVRQIGLFSGGLVSIYLIFRGRFRAILPLCVYWAIAAATTYATWPYLWADPIGNLILSFNVVPEFGIFNVLFRGEYITSATLPWSYLPTLIVLDLTETALALAVVGLAGVAWRLARKTIDYAIVAIVGVWFIVPIVWQITQRVPMYNNLRHFLFILPPLFVLAGIGFEVFAAWIRHALWTSVFTAVVFVPSLVGIMWLHPYEYSYFNSLAGGVSGASGNYDLDYWCTSLKEGVEVINDIAGFGDIVQVFGPFNSAVPYARTDLVLVDRGYPRGEADIVLVCSHRFGRGWWADSYHLVYQVRRGEAVFGEVWQRQSPATDPGAQ